MHQFKNIQDFNKLVNLAPSRHPLIDIRKYSEILTDYPQQSSPVKFGFYKIAIKTNFKQTEKYGKTAYDSNQGVMYFIEPGQTLAEFPVQQCWNGYQILMHADIFKNKGLTKNINAYTFFGYDTSEGLFLTDEEVGTVNFLMKEAWNELNNKEDEFSVPIILSYVNTLLNIIERLYTRQFDTRKVIYNQLTADFLQLLKNYYTDAMNSTRQPSVHYFSEKLHVTPNYLSDIIKHYTGKPALSLIHEYVIEEAKVLLTSSGNTVAEISDKLGFEYANYFARLFRKKTNLSPSAYRKSVKSI